MTTQAQCADQRVKHGESALPELVGGLGGLEGQQANRRGWIDGGPLDLGIAGEANKTGLGNRTGRAAVLDIHIKPGVSGTMVGMLRPHDRMENIHIEQVECHELKFVFFFGSQHIFQMDGRGIGRDSKHGESGNRVNIELLLGRRRDGERSRGSYLNFKTQGLAFRQIDRPFGNQDMAIEMSEQGGHRRIIT